MEELVGVGDVDVPKVVEEKVLLEDTEVDELVEVLEVDEIVRDAELDTDDGIWDEETGEPA